MSAELPPPDDGYEYDDDSHSAAGEAQTALAWQDALEWAQKRDVKHLANLLRGNLPLQDDRDVRLFLADVLEAKFKFPRGKPAMRPEWKWAVDAAGQITTIDPRHEKTLSIRNWVRRNRATLGDRVYEQAARHFNVVEATIENADRRSAKSWNKVRSK